MRFGWLSDTHLDSLQYGMERRRQDFALALEGAVDMMLERKIHVIIHSGDIINSNRPSPGTMQFLQMLNDRLRRAYAVMYVVSGNHDRSKPHWVETLVNPDPNWGIQLLDFRHVKHPDEDKNGFDVTFYGVPAMSAGEFRAHPFQPADVLVTHQMIKEFVAYEQTDVISLADIPKGYKLVAVGDIHEHKIIEQADSPGCYIGYPGSTEIKSEAEDGNKYWVLCTIDINKKLTLEPVRIPTRAVLRVDLTSAEVTEDIINMRIGEIATWAHQHRDERKPIVFITYRNTLTQVMPKFKSAFDPNDYILRFNPIFGRTITKNAEGQMVETQHNLSVEDILRAEISTTPELFGIAQQLIRPDVDENAALDEFIAGRLRDLEAAPATANS